MTKGWADAGFKQAVVGHGTRLGIDVEIVQRDPGARGFTPEPSRWVVEQTFGTLLLHRRLVRDYETRPASSVAVTHWSMTDVMLRRLTRTATLTWRDASQASGSGRRPPARLDHRGHGRQPAWHQQLRRRRAQRLRRGDRRPDDRLELRPG